MTQKPLFSLFPIPEGAEDELSYIDEPDDFSADFETDEEVEQEVFYDDGHYEDVDELETPESFSVISQTIRRAPGGQHVIDVVIETDDVPGAVKYEIQVAKIAN